LTITAWLYRARQRIGYTLVPMLFVLAITLWALVGLVVGNLRATRGLDIELVNAVASAALVCLAVYLAVLALFRLRGDKQKDTLLPAHPAASLE
jgi:carbon starvation protein